MTLDTTARPAMSGARARRKASRVALFVLMVVVAIVMLYPF